MTLDKKQDNLLT